MKKLITLALALLMVLSMAASADVPDYVNTDGMYPAVKADGPEVTISILTTRNSTATNDIEDVWFFRYLADVMNVQFELEQTLETNQRISLMFASGELPDLVWGIGLSNSNVMTYGVEEGMLLSWNDLLVPELMPNACLAMEDYPDAFTASMAPDGNIYTLPYITGSSFYANTGSFSASVRMYINTEWLELCGLDMPTTLDEYLDVLRTFKEVDPMGLGDQMIPLIGNQNKDKDFVWKALGFHGSSTQSYGTAFDLKNNQLVLPCYSEEAKAFIEFYHTLYTEGLVSPDYFTLDQTANRGLMATGVCGVLGDSTLAALNDAWRPWECLAPLTSDYNDKAVASIRQGFATGLMYASANTEHPEVLARIVDYMYSDEGSTLYHYGPMKDSDIPTYDMLEGWFMTENGEVTSDPVLRGEYTAHTLYAYEYVKSILDVAGRYDHYNKESCRMAGYPYDDKTIEIVDQLTGDIILSVPQASYTDDNNDGHWRTTQSETMINHLTAVRLPAVYLSNEQNQRVADLSTVINDHVTAETAKFIVGTRSLDELDDYFQELRDLGIEEYIEIHEEAYAGYIATLNQ